MKFKFFENLNLILSKIKVIILESTQNLFIKIIKDKFEIKFENYLKEKPK